MQTFLPYPSFEETAIVLDYKRLGKQRVECKQILTALTEGKGWIHHPATKMWKGFESALIEYSIVICKEFRNRGYKDSLLEYFEEKYQTPLEYPKWLGYDPFHSSHRSNLLRKDKAYYSQFNWTEPSNMDYIWPKGV